MDINHLIFSVMRSGSTGKPIAEAVQMASDDDDDLWVVEVRSVAAFFALAAKYSGEDVLFKPYASRIADGSIGPLPAAPSPSPEGVNMKLEEDVIYQKIIEHIRRNSGVTFVEIVRILQAHGIPTEGNQGVFKEGAPNVVFWVSSPEAAKFIQRVMADPHCVMKQTQDLVYILDGAVLPYPIATNIHHKTIHWAPVVFNWDPEANAQPVGEAG